LLNFVAREPLREILCLGAHSDDIEIGCGGTVLRLVAENPEVRVHWVVLSAEGNRADEARASAQSFLHGAGEASTVIETFPERFFPYEGASIKRWFDGLGKRVTPQLVFTHRQDDVHQDHRTVAELTWNTFRDHLILEYEIPKWEGDLGRPNVFVPIEAELAQRKIDLIMAGFRSQRDKYWFTPETFHAVLRLRGVEARAPSGLAEAFHGHKVLL
jgi:LmbE family N-acetylglucosaminyl deacetylase